MIYSLDSKKANDVYGISVKLFEIVFPHTFETLSSNINGNFERIR